MKRVLVTIMFTSLALSTLAQSIHRTSCRGDQARLDSMLLTTSIDVLDDRGRSLLHWAVACKQSAMVDYLVEKGINTSVAVNQGKTAMHVAVQ